MQIKDSGKMEGVRFESSCRNDLQSNLNVRQYIPDQSSYAARVSEDQWESVRDVVGSMHKAGRSRSKMLEILADQHNFRPSVSQINARMTTWGYRVRRAVKSTKSHGVARERSVSNPETLLDAHKGMQSDSVHEISDPESSQTSGLDEHAEPTYIIEQRIFDVLDTEIGLTTSEKLLVLNDVADFLVYSTWASSHRQFLESCYIYFTGNKRLAVARLLLIQECLVQFRDFNAPFDIQWLHQQFRRCMVDLDPMLRPPNELLIESCSEIGASICPRKDWTTVSLEQHPTYPGADPHSTTKLKDIEYSLPAPFNHMHAKNNPRCTNEDDKTCRRLIHPLLTWCSKEQEDLDLTYSFSNIGNTPVEEYLTRCTCIELACHLIKNWIDYSRTISNANHCLCLEYGSDALQPDLILFKSIIRGFALLACMIVKRSIQMLTNLDHELGNMSRNEEFSTLVAKAFRSAMEALELDLVAGVDIVSNAMSPATSGEPVGEQLHHLTELVSVVTQECCVLRRQGLPTYHQHALHWVREHTKDSKATYNAPHGLDPMLWNASSDASFQSFCRGGIKSKDRLEPPAMSGPLAGSSYSIRSGRSSIFKLHR